MEGRVKPHLPVYTKHRKGKGQFRRKKNSHWSVQELVKELKIKKKDKNEQQRV
jgi:hypothetical protein